ncbi:MAG: glycosyltransferase family 39 protein [Candidatus Omnitrophica bacterium]|nr:glycosyltransferase family 39 protein [Candidatus Omnitrophota bacterium]
MKKNSGYADKGIFLVICLYLLLVGRHFFVPISPDEISTFISSLRIAQGLKPFFFHSPLIYYFLYIFQKAIPLDPVLSSRLMIVLVQFVMIFLVYRIMKLTGMAKLFIYFILLFMISPLGVTGALAIDIDNSLLCVMLLAFSYYLIKIIEQKDKPGIDYILCIVFFALSLWTKLTTPIFFSGVFLSVILCNRSLRNRILTFTNLFILGGGLFIFSLYLFSKFFDWNFLEPFLNILGRFNNSFASPLSSPLVNLTKNVLFLGVWASPFALLLLIFVIKRSLDSDFPPSVYIFISFVYCAVFYLCFTFVAFGYPKYSFTSLVFLILFLLYFLQEEPLREYFTWIAFLVFVFLPFGDPILDLRFGLRDCFARQSHCNLLLFAIKPTLYLTIFLLLYFLLKFKTKTQNTFLLSIFISMISYNVSLNINQMFSIYSTNYSYGETGLYEVAKYIKPRIDINESVIAPLHLVYYLGRMDLNDFNTIYNTDWEDKDNFFRMISSHANKFLVLSVASNSIKTYDLLKQADIKDYLEENFIYHRIGSFDIWQRKQ